MLKIQCDINKQNKFFFFFFFFKIADLHSVKTEQYCVDRVSESHLQACENLN